MYFQSLNLASVSDVRTTTEIYQGATSIDSRGRSIHFLIQYPALELVVLEMRKKTSRWLLMSIFKHAVIVHSKHFREHTDISCSEDISAFLQETLIHYLKDWLIKS